MAIRRLPEFLINQIKAGEVIERPAALVKELLENSLDAHAQHITLHLLRGGLDLIHIADDGHGMNAEDLALAFERHATSKITNFEDLYHLQSFGFRGEALASAAAVARIEGQSTPREAPTQGHKIILTGENQKTITPIATDRAGTQLWIRDLFYNTPARLKFVRSLASEKLALRKVLNAFLLAYPEIAFTLQWDEEDKKIYPATNSLAQRWEQIFPRQKECLIWQASYEDYAIKGIIALEATSHKNPYWFCNRRYFQDKTLHQIVAQTMQNLWHGRSGLYAVFISASPERIDVNVHPNKLTIKFANPAPLYALLSSSLKKEIENRFALRSHLTSGLNSSSSYPQGPSSSPLSPGELPLTREDITRLAAPAADDSSSSSPAFSFPSSLTPDDIFTAQENFSDDPNLISQEETKDEKSPAFPLIHPPEWPEHICYVFQGHTYLMAIHHLLAATWEMQQSNRTPLLVVRHWDRPLKFSSTMAQELGPFGLAAEVMEEKIFLREVPTFIMRYDLWPLITALLSYWPTQIQHLPRNRWQRFWTALPHLLNLHDAHLNLSDATLSSFLQELSPEMHQHYGQKGIFVTASGPMANPAASTTSAISPGDLHA